jgi:hypothetical protein
MGHHITSISRHTAYGKRDHGTLERQHFLLCSLQNHHTRLKLLLCTVVAIALGNILFSDSAARKTSDEDSNSVAVAVAVPFISPQKSNCLAPNSPEWLSSTRYHNTRIIANETLGSQRFLAQMTINLPQMLLDTSPYLEQSLAHTQSHFLNVSESTCAIATASASTGTVDQKCLRRWMVRLVYLAMLYHQHKPAISEAYHRLNDAQGCQSLLQQYNIGNFDFECPDTKFIVGGLTNNGLGSNIRAATTTLLMAALITNRTAVLIQNSPIGPRFLRKPWTLASCFRRDFQCFFLPTTPCVPTWKDIEKAYILEGDFDFHFATEGKLRVPAKHIDDKVWILLKYGVNDPPHSVRNTLYRYVSELLRLVPVEDPQRPMMYQAMEQLTAFTTNNTPPGFPYPAAYSAINHALEFYALRPNSKSRQQVAQVMQDIVPSDLDNDKLLGLPIRASDKCYRESECLPFHEYMRATDIAWRDVQHNSTCTGKLCMPTILFTTEAAQTVREQESYSNTSSRNFLINTRDVVPNTGLISQVADEQRFTADENMLSVITTLSFQLLPRATLGNCCSNFHMLMNE